VAIALTVIGLTAALWTAGNQTALWTFAILWAMRLSTKFNIFLGVPNITEEFLPSHLEHLKSYFRNRALNLLFPLSVTAGTILTLWLGQQAWAASPPAQTTFVLLTTLAALGVIEHWFLVLPWRDEELWRWYLRNPVPNAADETDTTSTEPSTITQKADQRRASDAFSDAQSNRGLFIMTDTPTPNDNENGTVPFDGLRSVPRCPAGNLITETHEHPVAANDEQMDYEAFFNGALEGLRDNGNYRVFAHLERKMGAFPRPNATPKMASMMSPSGAPTIIWAWARNSV
jgi:hypothetical protein